MAKSSVKTEHHNLHIVYLIDNSGSMAGERIEAVNSAIKGILPQICDIEKDDQIFIFIRAIKFDFQALWHVGPKAVPVSRFNHFNWVEMDASGSACSTAQAIDLLTSELDTKKIGINTLPSVIILISDGICTDKPGSVFYESINRLNEIPLGKKSIRLSIGIGDYDKDQLDSFISPYLRLNQDIETYEAADSQMLFHYIQNASLFAIKASANSNIKPDDYDTPVKLPVIKGTVMKPTVKKAATKPTSTNKTTAISSVKKSASKSASKSTVTKKSTSKKSVTKSPAKKPIIQKPININETQYEYSEQSIDSDFIIVVQRIISERGLSILENYPRCKFVLQDINAAKFIKEGRLLLITIESGCTTEIARTSKPEKIKHNLITKLHEEYFLDINAADQIISLLLEIYQNNKGN